MITHTNHGAALPLPEVSAPPVEHEETRTPRYDVWPPVPGLPFGTAEVTGTVSRCKCGDHWSFGEHVTTEEMDSTFAAHVKYFHRQTVTL